MLTILQHRKIIHFLENHKLKFSQGEIDFLDSNVNIDFAIEFLIKISRRQKSPGPDGCIEFCLIIKVNII